MATNYRTLTDSVMQQTGTMPLVDAHMHIQGNDIAPIPIMRGIAVMSLNIEKRLNNKIINYEELSYLVPNDKVDPVPGFFAGGIRESDIAVALVTLFTFLKGERQRLTDLTAMLMDYGKVARHPSYLSAGVYMNDVIKTTMGMASHASKREITDSNRKKSEDERTKLVAFRKTTEGEFQDAARHYYLLASGDNSPSIGASFQFSICLGMELMYAHYWGAYGIPIYIPIKDKLYFPINELNLDVSYSTPTGYESDTVRLHHAYDLPNQSIESAFEIWEGETKKSVANKDNLLSLASLKPFDTNSVGKTEKYSLFLSEVDSREAWQFEDHDQHVEYMKMAALKYPFKILPFYHLDARRFFAPSDSASLDKTHNFYIQKNTKLVKVSADEIASTINERSLFKYKMSIEDVKKQLLPGGGVFFGVKLYMALGYPPYIGEGNYGKNPFPALSTESYAGFRDFLAHCAKNDVPVTVHSSPQGMTIADPGVYLKEYLKQHSAKFKEKGKAHFPIDGRSFFNGLGLIDSFSSPQSWIKVLNDDSLADLRIDLAHFGGMGFMNGKLDLAKTPYIWKEDIAKMIEGKPLGNDSAIQGQVNKLLGKDSDVCKAKVYTDISCYTMAKEFGYPDYLYPYDYRKIRTVPAIEKMYQEQQHEGNTVYQRTGWDRAVETEEELQQSVALKIKMVEEGLCGDKGAINNVAESLKKLISKYPKLRTRIMFGTDWPMTEMSVKGVARYNSAMFMMLALLTQKLGNEWDAWHQFAVINPLAFMGLIEEDPDDTEETVFEVNKEKLETLKNNLIACNKTIEANNDARRKKWNLETVEADNTRIEEAFKNLCLGQKNGENYIVPSSKKMRDAEGRLFITKE